MAMQVQNQKNLLLDESRKYDILGNLLCTAENYYLCQDKDHDHEKAKFSNNDSFINYKKKSPSEIKQSLIFQIQIFKDVNLIQNPLYVKQMKEDIKIWKNGMKKQEDKDLYDDILKIMDNGHIKTENNSTRITKKEDKDDRGWFEHKIHQWGHQYNARRKEKGLLGIEEMELYKIKSPKKSLKGPWSIGVDKKRAEYHRQKAEESWKNLFGQKEDKKEKAEFKDNKTDKKDNKNNKDKDEKDNKREDRNDKKDDNKTEDKKNKK